MIRKMDSKWLSLVTIFIPGLLSGQAITLFVGGYCAPVNGETDNVGSRFDFYEPFYVLNSEPWEFVGLGGS